MVSEGTYRASTRSPVEVERYASMLLTQTWGQTSDSWPHPPGDTPSNAWRVTVKQTNTAARTA